MESHRSPVPAASEARQTAPSLDAPRRTSSLELLGRNGVLVIEHAGREYRLRVTQNGKLILTA